MLYPELKNNVDSFATALHKLENDQGKRIATLLPTSIQFIISDYAISRLGLVHVPCSFLEPYEILEYKFKESSPKVLICLSEHLELALKLKKNTSIKYIILTK